MATDYRKQMEEAARIAQTGMAPPSVATPVPAAPPAPQVQPQIISTTPSSSPRTPDAQAAYLAPAGAPPPQPQIVSTIPGESPRTPDAQAAYLAPAGAAPAPSVGQRVMGAVNNVAQVAAPGYVGGQVANAAAAAAPSLQVPAPLGVGAAIDLPAQVASDTADAYRAGAKTSTPTGVGMAAREAINSTVSRAGGAVADAAGTVGRGIYNNVLRPLGEGVRAFVTGRPAAPSVATPAPAVQEPLIRQPAPGYGFDGKKVGAPSVAAPAVQPVAARQPATIDAATGQPIVAGPQPIFQQGSMSVYQQGNQRVIVGDNPAPVRVARQPSVGVPVVQAPAQVTAVPGSRASGRSALGGFMGTAAGLSVARGQNSINQRDFKNQLSVAKLGMEGAKTAADVKKSAADTAKVEADNRDREQLTNLRTQLVNETDPKKRAAIERKITAIAGKAAPKFQVVTVKTVDPATGGQIETPYILDEQGNARPVVAGAGAQQGVSVEAAKAAVARGADKNAVNKRLQEAGLPTI